MSFSTVLRLIRGGRTAEPRPADLHKTDVLFAQAQQAPDEYRTFHHNIAGESFHEAAIDRCYEGMPVQLTPEPENPHDPDAVRVTTAAGDIGYLPADSRLKAEFDPERYIAARIASIRGSEHRGVILEILARRGRL